MEKFDVIIKMPLPSKMKNANIINKTGKEKFKGATTVFSAMCLCWNADLNNTYKVENVYDIPDYLNMREADNILPSR